MLFIKSVTFSCLLSMDMHYFVNTDQNFKNIKKNNVKNKEVVEGSIRYLRN